MFLFAGLLFISFLLRVWLAAFGGVHPDEAYYWAWSLRPALGYFDHPPMLAWIITASRYLVQHLFSAETRAASPLFYAQVELRFLPYFLSSVVTPLILGRCIEVVQKRPLGLTQILLLLSCPVFFFGPLVITPDTPLFVGWATCLLISLKFLRVRGPDTFPGDPTPTKPMWAAIAGVALAFSAYSKYSALLGAFLFAITGAGLMNSLIAAAVAAVLIVPHIYWNYTVGLPQEAGIFFQFQNAVGSSFRPHDYKRLGDLWATQLLLWNPFIFLGCFLIPLRDLRRLFVSQKKSMFTGILFVWAIGPLIFFSISSLKRPAEGNWPLVGVLGATVLIFSRLEKRLSMLLLLFVTNLVIGVTGVLVLTKNQALADLIEPYSLKISTELRKPSRLNEFQDWGSLRDLVFEATRSEKEWPVEIHTYQTLSELLFQDNVARKDQQLGPRLKIWWDGSRRSEFHLHPEYLLPSPKGNRWLLARSDEKAPAECHPSQTLFKGIKDPRPFTIYKCPVSP